MIDRNGKRRLMIIGIILNHLWNPQLLHIFFRHRHADQPFAVCRHKINIFCRGKLRRAYKIAFVLTILIICH